jgi:hypothetical protein
MTTCGVPATRSLLRLDPTPAVHLTVRLFWRAGGFRARRSCPLSSGLWAGRVDGWVQCPLTSITVEAHAMIN